MSRWRKWLRIFSLVVLLIALLIFGFYYLMPLPERLFVACSGENRVAVIDAERLAVEGFIPTQECPEEVLVTRNGRQLFVANKLSSSIQVFDAKSWREVARYAVEGKPGGMRLDYDSLNLSIGQVEGEMDIVIKLGSLDLLPLTGSKWSIFSWLYKTDMSLQRAGRFSLHTMGIALPPQWRSYRLADKQTQNFTGEFTGNVGAMIDIPGTNTFLSTNVESPYVYVSRKGDNLIVDKIAVGERPSMLLKVNSQPGVVFVALRKASQVAVVDVAKRSVIKRIKVDRGPARLVLLPRVDQRYFVSVNIETNTLTLIDSWKRNAVKDIVVGRGPLGCEGWPQFR